VVIHLDTSFVIDLLREQARRRPGSATAFLEDHASDRLWISIFVACELEAGARSAASPDRERARLLALLQVMAPVYPDERFAPAYGDLLAALKRTGRTIATMDLLIGTAALVDGASLVTANRRHFGLIPGLPVLDY
jgi:tRNA(fMet)-specific endonuclease VapC